VKGKLSWSIFWALVGIFVVIASAFFIAAFVPAFRGSIFLGFIAIYSVIFFLLGVALIFLTIKEKVRGMPKKFLLLTGASAAGFLVFALIHNILLHPLLGYCEPVTFVITNFVCPIGFLVGAVGSIVLGIKQSRMAK
jgi:quinol-cytochrome oxidoreductase complex cytochrome b subunit